MYILNGILLFVLTLKFIPELKKEKLFTETCWRAITIKLLKKIKHIFLEPIQKWWGQKKEEKKKYECIKSWGNDF